MADYTLVTSQQKLPPQMTLADMMNLAGGIQQYQQRAATNPLALQQHQQLTEKGGYELNAAKQADAERQAVTKYLQDPSQFTDENGVIDLNKAIPQIYKLAQQTAHLYTPNLAALATSQTEIAKNRLSLNQSEKGAMLQEVGPLAYEGVTDPQQYITKINHAIAINPALKEVGNAYKRILSMQQPGDHVAKGMLQELQGLQPASEQFTQFAPTAGTVSLGGTVQPTVTTKSVAGSKPSITPSGSGMDVTPTPGFQTINDVVYFVDKNGIPHLPGSKGAISGGQTQPAPAAAPSVTPSVTTTPNAPPKFVSKLKTPEQVAQETNADPSISKETKASIINRYKNGYPDALADEKAKATPNIAPPAPPTTLNKPVPIPPPTGVQRAPLFKEENPIQAGAGVIPQMNAQQKTRYTNGQKIFSDAADANQKAADLGVVINNIKQTADQAQSSKPGQLLRQGGKWVAGNEQLDTLIKSLAQNQILQSQIMGGADSVNAQQTMAAATGSADIDPKALRKIAEQAEATKTATQMYNQGLTAYQKQDPQGYNSSIHANNFQKAWKDNYDPRIFMVENIHNSNMSPDQKAKEIARIKGIATPAELKSLQQKAYNIRRLQMGDF